MQFSCPGVHTCLPGDEIPEWFNHQFDGSSIHIKLPSQWHNENFLGFALCVVVTAGFYPSTLYCKHNLKANKDISWCVETGGFKSDHIFMWYLTGNYCRCPDAVEASFEFSTNRAGYDGTKKIKKCGIRVLYRQDVDEFRILNNQHLLEQSVANIPDQPQPNAQENVIDDLEALPPKKRKLK